MQFNNKIDQLREEIIRTTQEVIQIKSVQEAPLPGMPFGQGVHDAYWYMMNLAKNMGFEILDVDGYAGHIDMGTGEEVVGILAHLDVVPEGDVNNWTYPPYAAEIHDGKLYGRGTCDDKAPAVATLYAMKALKDSGVLLNKKVRLILGLNEESGWECMKHYMAKIKAPDVAFTPDAEFPAIHGEKGIMSVYLSKKLEKKQVGDGVKLISIKGGTVVNAVPDYCEATVSYDESLQPMNGVVLEKVGDTLKIKVKGISSHGSMPQDGTNAISKMFAYLSTLNLAEGSVADYVKFYMEKIGMHYNGEHIGCELADQYGKLTFNVGLLNMNEEAIAIKVDIRYPITEAYETVEKGIKEAIAAYGVEFLEPTNKASIYLPEDSELVNKLISVYAKHTGDTETKPITIGGGTYARAMKNCVAFGPNFPGKPEVAHQKDEFIAVEELILVTKIYADAIYELAK